MRRMERLVSGYIPWMAGTQLSEPAPSRTYADPLRDCVWTYLELDPATRQDALILSDADVPLEDGRKRSPLRQGQVSTMPPHPRTATYQFRPART